MSDQITFEEYCERMQRMFGRKAIILLGRAFPDLFADALRNAAEQYRWQTFWLPT